MSAQLGQYTPSDSGPWQTLFDDDSGEPHVMPAFGPKHILSRKCWCHPVLAEDHTETFVSYNVAQ